MRGTARLLLASLGLQKLDVHVGSVDADEFATRNLFSSPMVAAAIEAEA